MPTRSELNELYAAAHKLKQVTKERDALKAELAAIQKKYPTSFGEIHPRNPAETCSCEHWQNCAECHPTANEKEKTE